MIISRPQYKFIFIRIPKTASTSMKKALMPYIAKGYKIRHRYRDIKYIKNLVCAKCMLGYYFKFTFVRNPYDRIVSFYEYNRKVYQKRDKEWPYRKLKDFVLEKGDWWQFKQSEWIVNKIGKPVMNFIGRFENIEEDWKKVSSMLKLKLPPLKITNSTCHKHYREYYDNETRDIVTKIVKRDLELFNYVY